MNRFDPDRFGCIAFDLPADRAGAWRPYLGRKQSGSGRDFLCHLARHRDREGRLQARATMSEATPIVFVVDDDDSVRRALTRLIRSAGYGVECFESAREFLESHFRAWSTACRRPS